jgi:hypothetical protein
MKAHQDGLAEVVHRPTRPHVAAASVPAGALPSFLALQQAVGNRAISRLLALRSVQRCGPTPCDCPPQERADWELRTGVESPVAQRTVAEPCPAAAQRAVSGTTVASGERGRGSSGGDAGTEGKGAVSSAEVERVKAKVEQLINAGRKVGYKFAADNLDHWLNGNGKELEMPSAAFTSDPSIIDFLRDVHLPRLTLGAQERAMTGILKPGSSVPMTWQSLFIAPTSSQLFYALGGFQVKSSVVVTASAIPDDASSLLIRVNSWSVTCSDWYNFDAGKKAFIQLFGDIEDAELDQLRRAEVAHDFFVTSEPFNALQSLGPIEASVPRK